MLYSLSVHLLQLWKLKPTVVLVCLNWAASLIQFKAQSTCRARHREACRIRRTRQRHRTDIFWTRN
uniref:Uncharacterized protein n=1 Tax=Anguilla anguilla TaxID=7936 RepID=A0A0E9US56_ANGAN